MGPLLRVVSTWNYARPLFEPARGDTDRWERGAAGRSLVLLVLKLMLVLELLLLLLKWLLELLLALAETEWRGGVGVQCALVHHRSFYPEDGGYGARLGRGISPGGREVSPVGSQESVRGGCG